MATTSAGTPKLSSDTDGTERVRMLCGRFCSAPMVVGLRSGASSRAEAWLVPSKEMCLLALSLGHFAAFALFVIAASTHSH